MVHLFFDVDDTLYDQLQPFKRAFLELLGSDKDNLCEDVYKRSRYYSDQVFLDVENGRMTKEEMYQYRIAKALADYGIFIENQEAARFQEIYASCQKKIKLLPEMEAVLEWGREHAGVMGIITNGPARHQYNKIRQLGLEKWIDRRHMFISGEVKLAKPDVGLFHLIQKQFCLEPEQIYYIGDSFENDVEGAKQAGWKAIWMNRRKRSLPEHTCIRPDYVVGDRKGELREVLQRIFKHTLERV